MTGHMWTAHNANHLKAIVSFSISAVRFSEFSAFSCFRLPQTLFLCLAAQCKIPPLITRLALFSNGIAQVSLRYWAPQAPEARGDEILRLQSQEP